MKKLFLFILFLVVTPFSSARAFTIELQTGPVWQTRNDVEIPVGNATLFSLTELGKGPGFYERIYLSQTFGDHHEIRGLFAPWSLTLSGRLSRDVRFKEETFYATWDTKATYRFNSYRLTYRYLWQVSEKLKLGLGFTGKIRDAEIKLEQGGRVLSRANVGFVPLVNLLAKVEVGPTWHLVFDVDALASPYGRAEDVALLMEKDLSDVFALQLGYRTVEGGADGGGGVYNFAWLHFGVLGIKVSL